MTNQVKLETSPSVRNSAIELLRIIAMLFIVLSHFCVHSNFNLSQMPFSFNKTILQWGALGNLGVDIFMIISGFFLCKSKLKTKSISKLLTQVWFYSVFLFFIAVIFLITNILCAL